jgi:hypothetical protein
MYLRPLFLDGCSSIRNKIFLNFDGGSTTQISIFCFLLLRTERNITERKQKCSLSLFLVDDQSETRQSSAVPKNKLADE